MVQEKYFARRAFKYNGVELDRGQVMALAGFDNDEKLIRQGFLVEMKKDALLYQCGICGSEFISDRQRGKHGDNLHAGERDREPPVMTKVQGQREVNRMLSDQSYEPALVPDETISDQEKENQAEAPVYFDKTEASVRSGAGVTDIGRTQSIPEPMPKSEKLYEITAENNKVTVGSLEVTLPPGKYTAEELAAKVKDAQAPMAETTEKVPSDTKMDVGLTEVSTRFQTPPIVEKPLAGKDLAKWRKKQKLTQKETAEMLGVAVGSISRAEKLRKKPLGSKLAPALSEVLDR